MIVDKVTRFWWIGIRSNKDISFELLEWQNPDNQLFFTQKQRIEAEDFLSTFLIRSSSKIAIKIWLKLPGGLRLA